MHEISNSGLKFGKIMTKKGHWAVSLFYLAFGY